jgi:hypothetical protein
MKRYLPLVYIYVIKLPLKIEDVAAPESENSSNATTAVTQSLKKIEVAPASEDKSKKAKRKSQKIGKDARVIELRNQVK